MSSSQKRISKELQECTASPPAGMTVSLVSEADLHTWAVTLAGPAGTVYAGGVFALTVVLPPDYPFKAPQVTFATRIYHPNVTNDSVGSICLALLKPENWKPSGRVRAVLEAVRHLLIEPNPDDPLEARIADEFRSARPEFDKNARSYVARYAQQLPPRK
ncbi:ubiquitin-conjugating enzyme [Durotheca rogersii]|uniref:ubiquitin-conjugating enzyme n=1 Tax=Durotheca rogersii TaxID=419775 RepID=UPI00221E4AFE|nr:ubiquitin-conjugating enzyme [Durotheca rogersii]KAI5867362.1 ubiquitin-conjugating enzyme [Durotheca rogersii]